MKRAIRGFSSNARYTLPPFENEKFLHYPKGSKERALLEAELKRVRSEVDSSICNPMLIDTSTGC